MAQFKAVTQNFPRMAEENQEKSQSQYKMQTRHIPTTSQKCYHLSKLVQYYQCNIRITQEWLVQGIT
jgi:hypothetical protein